MMQIVINVKGKGGSPYVAESLMEWYGYDFNLPESHQSSQQPPE